MTTTLRFRTGLLLLTTLCCVLAPSAGSAQPFEDTAFIEEGIVEVENPTQAPCPDPFDIGGCDDFDGNTVWHDSNVNQDYYLSAGGGEGGLLRISRYTEAAAPFTFEMRFTETCAVTDTCFGVYAFTDDRIASVPFELWNIGIISPGEENDTSNDVRMIPFLNANTEGGELDDWSDTFTGTDPWADGPGVPITDWIYWMMPDRPDGYALFAATAQSAGGPGATYPHDLPGDNTCNDGTGALVDCDGLTDDGDDVININPLTGEQCGISSGPLNSQGYFVDFCYRNQTFFNNGPGTSEFIYPIGRLVVGDFAGDGTTPPVGTAIRFYTEGDIYDCWPPHCCDPPIPQELCEVGTDPNPSSHGFTLDRVHPNPIVTSAVVPFELDEAGVVRIVAYDVLGREVAVLLDEVRVAGSHDDVRLYTAGLANGLYVLRAEFGGASVSQKVLVAR